LIEWIGTTKNENASARGEEIVRDFLPFVIKDEDDKEDEECRFEEIHGENERIMTKEEKHFCPKRKYERTSLPQSRKKLLMGYHCGTLTQLQKVWKFPSITWTQLIQKSVWGKQRRESATLC
jgi:hypothetical protein